MQGVSVVFRTALPCSGGYHLERGGMPMWRTPQCIVFVTHAYMWMHIYMYMTWRTPQCIVFITHAYVCMYVYISIYICVYVYVYALNS